MISATFPVSGVGASQNSEKFPVLVDVTGQAMENLKAILLGVSMMHNPEFGITLLQDDPARYALKVKWSRKKNFDGASFLIYNPLPVGMVTVVMLEGQEVCITRV